jgi:hypothetical protein
MWMFAPALDETLFTNELGTSEADQNPDVVEKILRNQFHGREISYVREYVRNEQNPHVLVLRENSVMGHLGSANLGHLANQTRVSSKSACPITRLMLAQG